MNRVFLGLFIFLLLGFLTPLPIFAEDDGVVQSELHLSASTYNVTPESFFARDGSELLLIPAGEFEMGDGSRPDNPKRTVYLDAYYIGKYAVTNARYARFVNETGHRPPDNKIWSSLRFSDHPVVNISWDDAMAYAEWAGCTLPTEAQWEKAARGPDGSVYPWGGEWDPSKCRHNGNRGRETTAPVHAYPEGVSGYGIYQQAGNVWEWCYDWYDKDYYDSPEAAHNPMGPSFSLSRVYRGGSWWNDASSRFRGTFRNWFDPSSHYEDIGFRLAMPVSTE